MSNRSRYKRSYMKEKMGTEIDLETAIALHLGQAIDISLKRDIDPKLFWILVALTSADRQSQIDLMRRTFILAEAFCSTPPSRDQQQLEFDLEAETPASQPAPQFLWN
jgi:hypothetical protein